MEEQGHEAEVHHGPEPKRLLEAPLNITDRLGTRQLQSFYNGHRRDRHFVFSRFKPWRSCYTDDEHAALFTCISLLGDHTNHHLAIGTHSGEIKIFDASSCRLIETLSNHEGPVTLAETHVSDDNNTQLLLSSSSNDVQLTRLPGGYDRSCVYGCKAAKFSNSGRHFAALSLKGPTKRHVLLFDVETFSCSSEFTEPPTPSWSDPHSLVHFSPCDTLILWNGCLWDPRVQHMINRFDQFADYGGGGFHPYRNEVIINSEVCDLRTMRILQSVPSLDQTSIAFNSRGDVIYAKLRRNIDDLMSAVYTSRVNHPLFAAFLTVDATNYSDIATIPVDRCLLDFATEPTDSFLGLITLEYQDDKFPSARMFEIGRR